MNFKRHLPSYGIDEIIEAAQALSTSTDLRQLDDADEGCPDILVREDYWAVAVPDGTARVAGQPVNSRRRPTAVVNVGIHISAIREHLQMNDSDLCQRIDTQT